MIKRRVCLVVKFFLKYCKNTSFFKYHGTKYFEVFGLAKNEVLYTMVLVKNCVFSHY